MKYISIIFMFFIIPVYSQASENTFIGTYDSSFVIKQDVFLASTNINLKKHKCHNGTCSKDKVLILTFNYNDGKDEKYLWTADWDKVNNKSHFDDKMKYRWDRIVVYDENNQFIRVEYEQRE